MIALLGGSFNPIHRGHTGLAQWIVANGHADETWLMVSPQNPLKNAPDLVDEATRLKWARMACEPLSHVAASDFEFTLPRPSYTYQTLKALHKAYPQKEFALTIGADNWLLFHQWKNFSWILQHVPILVYPRKGFEIDASTLPKSVKLIPAPLFPYSSTAIRQQLRQKQDVSTMLDHNVLTDIIANKSYLA